MISASAFAQVPFVFEEKLYLAPDGALTNGQVYTGGQTVWDVTRLGTGDLIVDGEVFSRTTTSTNSTEVGALRNDSFTPFISDSWVMRATVVGTNNATNTPFNTITLSVGGPSGAYGFKILPNRTDGNADFNFGQDGSFNDLFNGDMFPVNSIVSRPLQMTLVNRASVLHAFVDDYSIQSNPTNVLISSTPTTGTIGVATWDNATVTLGARATGTVDDIRFYNVRPYVESFITSPSMTTIDPMPPVSIFDNTWTILDLNSPARWRANMNHLEWKGSATLDPAIQTESADTLFNSDSWIFEATITYASTSNLGTNRVVFEFEPQSGITMGVIIPRGASSGRRLMVYTGTESNVVASTNVGTDTPVNFRARFSIICVRGQMQIRLNDRALICGQPQTGIGAQPWRRVNIRGDKQFGFTVDAILYHDIGSGLLSVSDSWAEYE